jgi:SulP family sulfate permease
LSNSDSFVIGLIVLSTLLISMLAAIAIGIIVACIIFAVVYARLPVFHRTDTIVSRRSSVDRSPAQNAFLDAHGGDVHILALQGFLFFGSSEQLVSKVHQLLGTNPKPGKIIFDLKRVNGLDSAAVSALFKLTSIAAGTDTKLVLAEAQGETLSVLKAGGFTGRARGHLEYRDTTDDAIEEAEEDLIRLHASKDFEDSALSTLRGLMTKPELAVRLLDTMELRTLRPGERLIKFGEEDTDVYLIDRGRLAVIAKTSAGTDLRVRSLRAGSFVGEIASYAGLARTADVIAEVETKVYFATAETLAQSVEQDPELASEWHKAVASSLAEKLHRTTLHLRESV